jgi:hypothetical protein
VWYVVCIAGGLVAGGILAEWLLPGSADSTTTAFALVGALIGGGFAFLNDDAQAPRKTTQGGESTSPEKRVQDDEPPKKAVVLHTVEGEVKTKSPAPSQPVEPGRRWDEGSYGFGRTDEWRDKWTRPAVAPAEQPKDGAFTTLEERGE